MACCLTFSSSRILQSGRNADALWCFMRSGMRSPDWVCQSWSAIDRSAAGEGGFPHHVQVKSGVESQIETISEDSDSVCGVVL